MTVFFLLIVLSLGIVLGWCLHALLVVPDVPVPVPAADSDVVRRVEQALAKWDRPAAGVTGTAPPTVHVVFLDQHERAEHGTATIAAQARRPTLTHAQRKYSCVRQDATGRFIYREVRQ